jgi:hypothetical protein
MTFLRTAMISAESLSFRDFLSVFRSDLANWSVTFSSPDDDPLLLVFAPPSGDLKEQTKKSF